MKKKVIISVSIAILFILSIGGFYFWNKSRTSKFSDPDIILARECGQDKLPCCDADPPCSYGQKCCTDPNDPSINYCADECTCGSDDEFCCRDEPKCKDGHTCHNGRCQTCGALDQPCCGYDKMCNQRLGCLNEYCVQCGLNGHPCCQEGIRCANEGKTDINRAECHDNFCQPCGSNNHPSCFGDFKCLGGHLQSNNVCFPCGGKNQPCCDQSAGRGFDCDPKEGLKCNVGFCSK